MVIAIIAILASMLLPALSKAREKARSIQCVNTLKAHGYWWTMYQEAFDDYLLPATDSKFATANQRYCASYWPEMLMHKDAGGVIGVEGVKGSSDFPFSHLLNMTGDWTYKTVRNPTYGAAKYLTCPTAIGALGMSSTYNKSGYTHYAYIPLVVSYSYNGHFSPHGKIADGTLPKIVQYRKGSLSDVFVMGDSWKRAYFENDYAHWYITWDSEWVSIKNYNAHANGANVLWMDTHVAATQKLSGSKNIVPWYYY